MSNYATTATRWNVREVARVVTLGLMVLAAAGCQEEIIPPTAVIDAPEQATTGTVVQVSGADSIAPLGGSLTFSWAFASQPAGSEAEFNDPNLVNPSFLADVSGTYEIILVVTEGDLSSAPTRAVIEASPCGEQVPTVDSLGTDPEQPSTGDRVTLLATASDGDNSEECGLGQRLSYEWTVTDRPRGSSATLDDRRILNPTLLADVSGKYSVTLEVRDDTGLSSGPIELAFEVFDCGEAPPVINSLRATPANPAAGQQVRLSSRWVDRDNDSSCDAGQTVTFQWQLTQRPVGSRTVLDEDTTPEPNLTPDIAGDYTVVLTITDSTGRDSAPVELTFTAGECGSLDPQIDEVAVTPVSPNTGDDVELRIRVSDPDNDAALCGLNQALSVESRFVQRPSGSAATLSPPDGLRTGFSPDVPGTYVIRTTVSDDTGRSVFTDTEVVAAECGDAAPAITGVTITPEEPAVGQLVALDLETEDADNNPDGCALEQALTVTSSFVSLPSGSSATLVPAIGTQPGFTPDVPGVYVIHSVIRDDTGRSSSFDSTVEVGECGSFAPTVTDVSITPEAPNTGDAIILDLTVEDRDNSTRDGGCALNQVVTVSNSFVARPAGSEASLVPSNGPRPAFVADLPGEYVVRTVAMDDTGLSTTTDTPINVSSCGSAAPTVVGSSDPASPNTGDAVTVNLVIDDADNDPAGCGLSQTLDVRSVFTGRPAGSSATLSTSRGLAPGFIADIPGRYTIESTVTDETGRTGTTETDVDVSVCGSAEPEVSSVVASPANPNTGSTVTFFITASDADNAGGGCDLGQVLEVETVFTRRPAGSNAELSSAVSLTPAFIADLPGEYAIRTTVTDDTGRSSSRTTPLTVAPCGSADPTVDSVVATPANPNTGDAVTFSIAVSDSDNNVSCGQGQGLSTSSVFVARPAGSSATLSSRLGLAPAFVADIPGVYTIRTTVTDTTGRSGSLETSVTASGCGAAPPSIDDVAVVPGSPNAGDDVALTISVSDADNAGGACDLGQDLVVESVFVARPAGSTAFLSTTRGLTPSFESDLPGVYIVRSTVTDSTGRSDVTETVITVSTCGAAPPSVDSVVASPASPATGDRVTWTISVSDADNAGGCGLSQTLTTTSTFIARPAGSAATLSTAEGLAPAFVADVPGAYTIRTVVVDDTGRSDLADTTVTVSTCGTAPPTVTSVTVTPAAPNAGDEVTLDIVAGDADNNPLTCGLAQSVSARSSFVARPVGSTATLSTADGFAPSFVADVSGDYIVRTVVTDDTGASSFVDTPISVTTCGEAPPTIDAVSFLPLAPAAGDAVTLDITVSDADNGGGACSRGQILTVESSFVALPAGSAATLSTSAGLNPSFVADLSGDYTVRTRVTDSTGRSSSTNTTITVSTCGESPPVVSSVTVTPPAPNTGDTVSLAIVADDADNGGACGLSQTVSVSSAFIVRPAGSTASLSTTTGSDVAFEADVSGLYVVRVTATDSTGRSSFVDQPITVSGCGANAPVVDDITFTPASPDAGDSVAVAATVSDPDNDAPCSLSQVLTTDIVLLARPAGSSAVFTGSEFVADRPGTYRVRATVSDDTGLVGRLEDTVVVDICGAQAPTVDSVAVSPGTPNTGDSVTLTIAASDLDNAAGCSAGQTISLFSEFTARPAGSGATLSTAAGSTPSFVADVPGVYRVRTTATDSTGRSGQRETTVVVDTCGSSAPTVDAITVSVAGVPAPGDPAQVDTTDEVELSIVASDPDNTSCGLSQSLTLSTAIIAQPAGTNATVASADSASPTFVVPDPGSYTVEVTVTDSTGRSGTGQVEILADVCGSRAPLASLEIVSPVEAGPGNSVTAPDVATGSSLLLDATSSSDPDDGCLSAAPPLTYTWRFVEVPSVPEPSFSDVNHAAPSFTAQDSGDYVVAVDVSDGFNTSTATLTVNVNPAAALGTPAGFSVSWIDGSSGSTPHWSSPFGVAPGPSGGALVAQSDSNTVTINNSPALVFASGGRLRRPMDIVPFGAGVLVSNSGSGASTALVALDAAGAQSSFLASGGPVAAPRGISAFHSDLLDLDVLLVADRDDGVDVLDTSGALLDTLGFNPGCDLWGAAGQGTGSDDRIYATSPTCDAVFASDHDVPGGPLDHLARVPEPYDVAVHPTTGDLYVATRGGVMVVEDCGATDGSCPAGCLMNELPFARGLSFDSDGTLLVTGDTPGDLFRIDGDFTTLFDVSGPDLSPYCVDDPYTTPLLTIASNGDAAEGDGLLFTIESSEIVFEDVIINLAYTGTAQAPDDYPVPSPTVVLSAGSDFVQIVVPTIDDNRYDALSDETVTIEMIGATGAGAAIVVGSDSATGLIIDDEAPPVVTLPTPIAGVVEGNEIRLTIEATSEPFEDVTIDFTTSGTATDGLDYGYTGPIPGQIVLPEGADSVDLVFTTTDDDLFDRAGGANETVIVDLTGVIGAASSLGGATQQTTPIIDAQGPPQVSITPPSPATVFEGSDARFRIDLTTRNWDDLTVGLGYSGDVAPSDFTAVPTIVIPAGSDTVDLDVPIIQDFVYEPDEDIVVEVLTISGDGVLSGSVITSATIAADPQGPSVSVSTSATPVPEGGNITFTFAVDQIASRPLDVTFALSGTATAGSDYLSPPTTVTIPALTPSVDVTATGLDDNFFDSLGGTETVVVTIVGVVGADAVVDSANDVATAVIADDESAPRATISASPTTILEGASSVVSVDLDTPTFEAVMIPVALSGTADAGDDYTDPGAIVLTIPALSTHAEVTIDTINDGVYDQLSATPETVVSTLGTLSGGGATRGTPSSASFSITDLQAAPVVTLSGPGTVAEGASATYTVSLTNAAFEDVTVDLTPTGTATSGADYTPPAPLTATVPALSTMATFSVPVLADDLYDALIDETMTWTISNATGADSTIGAFDSRTTTITEGDPAPTVSISGPVADVAEGTNAVFTVSLDVAAFEDVTVDVAALPSSTADLGDDYLAFPSQVVVPAGATSATLTVETLDDATYDAFVDETLVVGISSPAGANASIGTSSATATIDDAQTAPVVRIRDNNTPANEGTDLDFRVQLSNAAFEDVTVTFVISGGTATDGVDYNPPAPFEVVVPAGSAQEFLSIPTVADGVRDSASQNETVVVMIATATGAGASISLTQDEATGRIRDNEDAPQVYIVGSGSPLAEGTNAQFEFRLTNPTFEDITVTFTQSGTAVPGGSCVVQQNIDYDMPSTAVTISAGTPLTAVPFDVCADDFFDHNVGDNDTIVITLDEVTAGDATIDLSADVSTVPIDDLDAPPAISIGNATDTDEGDDAVFEFSLSRPAFENVDVRFTVGGSGDAGIDYLVPASNNVRIPAGSTAADVAVTTLDDGTYDCGIETVNLTVASHIGAEATIADNFGTGNIIDVQPAPTVGVSVPGTVAEGAGATFVFTLSGPTCEDVDVDYLVSGTATPVDDHDGVSGQVTILEGGTTASYTINAVDDGLYDSSAGNETIVVTIDSLTGGGATINGAANPATVGIIDDETPPVVSVTGVTTTVTEGTALALQLSITPPSGEVIAVDFTTSGAATEGTDYDDPTPDPISIPINTTTQAVSIPTTNDNTYDALGGSETFTFTLDDASTDATIHPTNDSVLLTINDAQSAPTVSLTGPASAIDEDSGTDASFTFALSGTTFEDVDITYTLGGTATGGADYTVPGSLTRTITAGSTTVDLDIPVLDDGFYDTTGGNETIVVQVASVTGGGASGTPVDSAEIADDEVAPVITLSGPSSPVAEGGDLTFTVDMTPNPTFQNVTVDLGYGVASDLATSGSDYTAAPATATISAGNISVDVDVTTIDDGDNEAAREDFTVTISNPSGGGATLGSPTSAQGEILSEEPISVIHFDRLLGTGAELGSAGVIIESPLPNDELGSAVVRAGDVDGDSFTDFIVLADERAFLLFGSSAAVPAVVDVSSWPGGVTELIDHLALPASNLTATEVGDFNGDGFDDFAIGNPDADNGPATQAGSIWLVYGRPSWAPFYSLASVAGSPAEGLEFRGQVSNELLGRILAGGGDLDGDCLADLVVSAASDVYVIFGGSPLASPVALSAPDGITYVQLLTGHGSMQAGSLAVVGDLDLDGIDDLVIGKPRSNPGALPQPPGRAYAIMGSAGGYTGGVIDLTAPGPLATVVAFESNVSGDQLGTGVARLGDVDGDRIADFAVGSEGFNASASAVFVFHGGPALTGTFDINALGGAPASVVNGGLFGLGSGSSGGDVNGDGLGDLIVNALGSQAWVFYGGFAIGATLDETALDGNTGVRVRTFGAGGATVVGSVDANGDGFDDLLYGTPLNTLTSVPNAGQAYVVLGGDFRREFDQVGTAAGELVTLAAGETLADGRGGVDIILGNDEALNSLVGGTGDDALIAGADPGDTNFVGGAGANSVDLAASASLRNVDLCREDWQMTGAGYFDRFTGISEITGSDSGDSFFGTGRAEIFYGGDGDDVLIGGGGNDFIDGQANDDHIEGGPGNDILYGGPGLDVIIGEGGDDVIIPGQDSDTLAGGPGADDFSYFPADNNAFDVVTDFSEVQNDQIILNSLLVGFSGSNLEDWVEVTDNTVDTTIALDVDGTVGGTVYVPLLVLQGTVLSGNATVLVGNGTLVINP